MIYYLIAIIHILFFSHTIIYAGHKKSVMMYATEEKINGTTFMHRIDTIDGQRKEVWVIDGQQTTEYDYFDRVAQEEAVENKRLRQQESAKIREQQRFIAQEQAAILKKILCGDIQTIEKYLNKLSDARLRQYLMFEPASFVTQEELDAFIQEKLLKAQKLMDEVEPSLSELHETIDSLKPYGERAMLLYQHTLQAARERSDDTRLLKDLLHLVSESVSL